MNPITDDVLRALRTIIRATDLHSKKLSKVSGLTVPQLLVLQMLEKQGKQTVGDIAKFVNLSQATVTTIIDRLEKRHFVKRERGSTDKRRVYVSIENIARNALIAAPTPLQESFIRQFEALQDWEQSMILASLQRVGHMMDAEEIDASPVLDLGTLDRTEANL